MFLTKPKTAATLLTAGLTLFLATALVLSVSPRTARSDQPSAVPPSRDGSRKVVVETLKKSEFGRTTTQIGTVEAFESVDLTPKFSGYLKSLKVDIGDAVKRGQIVVEIDAAELASDLEKSQAVVEQARTRVIRAQAAASVVKASLEAVKASVDMDVKAQERCESMLRYQEKKSARYKDLVQKKAIPIEIAEEEEQRVETARATLAEAKAKAITAKASIEEGKAKLLVAQSDVDEAEAALRVARADQRKAAIKQEFTTIVSPLDGVVSRRNFHEGDFVRSGAEGGSVSLLTIIKTGKVRVVVQVPDRDVPLLDKGDRVTVRIDAIGDRVYQGTIARTAYAEDPATRTLRTEIDLDNSDGRLRPGQYGAVTIILEDLGNCLTIPASALIDDRRAGGEAACYRIEGRRAVRTRIKIGRDNGVRIELVDGLKEGDSVVIDSGPGISDGQLIESEKMEQVKKN